MKVKLEYKYLIVMRCRAKNGEVGPAFYIGEKDGKPAFSFDVGKAKFFDSRKEAKQIGFNGYKSVTIVKIPIGDDIDE